MGQGVRAALIVYGVISFVVGALMYLVPGWATALALSFADQFGARILGVALVSLGVGAWVASKEGERGAAGTVVLMCAIFTVLGAIACLYQVATAGAAIYWLYLVILVVLAAVFVGATRLPASQRSVR